MIVGWVAETTSVMRAAYWHRDGRHGYVKTLGESRAIGLGEDGRIVGIHRFITGEPFEHVIWEDESADKKYVGSGMGPAVGFAIREPGAFGYSRLENDLWEVHLVDDTQTPLEGSGAPFGGSPVVVAAKHGSWIVGQEGGYAAIWNGTKLTRIIEGEAHGVNSSGHVVGASTSGVSGYGFIWTPSTGVTSLLERTSNGSGWTSFSPMSINDAGRIVGVGDQDDKTRAFLLTPSS